MKTLIEDIEIIKKRIAHLRKLALKGGWQDMGEFASEIDSIKASINALQEKDVNLEGQISENDQEISKINEDNLAQGQAISSLQTGLSDAENTISQQSQQIGTIESTVGQNSQKISSLETSISQQEQKMETVEQTLETHEQSIQENFDRIDSCQITVGGVYNDVYYLRTKATANEEAIAALQTTTASHEERLTAVEGDLVEVEGNVSSIQTELATHTTEIDSLQTGVEDLQAKTNSLQTEVDSVASDLDGVENTVNEHSTTITQHQTTLETHEQSIQENYDKIDSCQITVGGVYNDVYALKDRTTANEEAIDSLETLVSGLSGNSGDILGAYSPYTKGYVNNGNGYIEFNISSNRILRIFFGIQSSSTTLTFDKPFTEVLWAWTVPCLISQTFATHFSTIATITTSAMSFVGAGNNCRFEVWGFIDV